MFNNDLYYKAESLLKNYSATGWKITAAESCTGGLIMGVLTEVPGSSSVIDRGFVTYSNEAKNAMLGVDIALIQNHGAVSEETARAMAEGALTHSLANVSVSVTGIAGPGGGSEQKPVGLVHLASACKHGETIHHKALFAGDRTAIRLKAVEKALELLEMQIAHA
jgi:nicotinamide-nucleotide amidase